MKRWEGYPTVSAGEWKYGSLLRACVLKQKGGGYWVHQLNQQLIKFTTLRFDLRDPLFSLHGKHYSVTKISTQATHTKIL